MPLRNSVQNDKFKDMHVLGSHGTPKEGALTQPVVAGQESVKEGSLGWRVIPELGLGDEKE